MSQPTRPAIHLRARKTLLRPRTFTVTLPDVGLVTARVAAPPLPAPRSALISERSTELYNAPAMARMVATSAEERIELLSNFLRYGAIFENDVYGWRGFPNKFVVRRKPESSTFTFIKFDNRGTHQETITEDPNVIHQNWEATAEFYTFWRRGGRVPIFQIAVTRAGRRVEYTGRDLPPYSNFALEKPLPQIELIWVEAVDVEEQDDQGRETGNTLINVLPDLRDPDSYRAFKMPAIHGLLPDEEGDVEIRRNVRRIGPDGEERNVRETRRFRRAREEDILSGIERLVSISREWTDIKERRISRGRDLPSMGEELERIMRAMGWTPSSEDPALNAAKRSDDISNKYIYIVPDETILTIWWPPAGRAADFSLASWVHPWAPYVLKEDKGTRAIRAGRHMCAFRAAVLTVGRTVPLRKNSEVYAAFDVDGVAANSRCWEVLRSVLPPGEDFILIDCRAANVPVAFSEKYFLVSMDNKYIAIENIKNVIALADGPTGPHWLAMSDAKIRDFLTRETVKTKAAVRKHNDLAPPTKLRKEKLLYLDFETAKDARDNTTEKHRHYVYGAAVMYDDVAKHFRPRPGKPVVVQLVEFLESLNFPFRAVMYNGRGFDSHFLVEAYTSMGYRVSSQNTIIAGSRYLKTGMTRGNFQATWDPQAFIPSSLDRAARDFGCACGGKIVFSHEEIEAIAEEASREVPADGDPNDIMCKIWEKIEERRGEKAVQEMIDYNVQDVRILKEVTEKLIECLKTCSVDLVQEYIDDARQTRAKFADRQRKVKERKIEPLDPTDSPTISNFAFSCLKRALTAAREVVGDRHAYLYTLLSTKYLFAGHPKRAEESTAVLNEVLGRNMDAAEAAFAYERIIRKSLIGGRCEITNPLTLREEKFSLDRDTPTPSTTEIPLNEPLLVPDVNGLYSHGAKGLFPVGELEAAAGLDDVYTKAGVHLVDVENQPAKAIIPIKTSDGRWDWKAGANYPAHDVEIGGVHFHRPEQVGKKITRRWLLATDIYELLQHGAKVTWHAGISYSDRTPLLEPFVRICDRRKNEQGISPAMRATWKIFQNSTYGKFLQKNRSETKTRIFSDIFSMKNEIIENPFDQVMGEAPQTLEVSEMTGGAWFVKVRAPWKPSSLPGIVGAQVYAHSRAHVYNNYFWPLCSQMPVRSPVCCDTDSAFMPLSSYRLLIERERTREDQFLAKDERDKKTGLSVVESAVDRAYFAARKAYWLSDNRLHEPGYCAELAPYAFSEEEWARKSAGELKPKTRLKGCRAASNPPPLWELKNEAGAIEDHGRGIGEKFFTTAIKNDIAGDKFLSFSHWHIKSSRVAGVMLLRGWKRFKA